MAIDWSGPVAGPISDKEIQADNLKKDQARLRKIFTDLYESKGKAMSEDVGRFIASTPEYKTHERKSMAKGVGVSAPVGAIAGVALRKKPKFAVPAALASLVAGGVGGKLKSRHDLKNSSKISVQRQLVRTMSDEAKKNVAMRSYLAQPGTQRVSVKRPWGIEQYVG